MNNSSQQDDYSITLTSSDITSLTSSDTITIDLSDVINTSTTSSFVYSTGTAHTGFTATPINTITISDLSTDFGITFPEEWINSFPDWDRIQQMCEQYPGLKIAFEKFKTTYNLVKDDYDTPEDKRIKP